MTPGRFPSPTPSRETSPECTLPEAKTPSAPSTPSYLDATPSPPVRRRSPRLSALPSNLPLQSGKRLADVKRPAQRHRNASDPLSDRTRKSPARKPLDKTQQLITAFLAGSPLQQCQSAVPQPTDVAPRPTKAASTGAIPQLLKAVTSSTTTVPQPTESVSPSAGPANELTGDDPQDTEVVDEPTEDDSEFVRHDSCTEYNTDDEPTIGTSTSSTPPSPSPSNKPARYRLKKPVSPSSTRLTHTALCSKIREPLTTKEGKGVIYIICDPERPKLGHKIGVTKRENYKKRIQEHEESCDYVPYIEHISAEVDYSLRMEKLILLDLEDHRRDWECPDHKKKLTMHKEWLQPSLSFDLAKSTVDKWEAFMLLSPYNEWKELEPIWDHVLDTRKFKELSHEDRDHDARRKCLNNILSKPTESDHSELRKKITRQWYEWLTKTCVELWMICQRYCWKLISMMSSLVTFVVCPNAAATLFCIAVWLSAIHSMASDGVTSTRSQKPGRKK